MFFSSETSLQPSDITFLPNEISLQLSDISLSLSDSLPPIIGILLLGIDISHLIMEISLLRSARVTQ